MKILETIPGVEELICGISGAAFYSDGILNVPSIHQKYSIELTKGEVLSSWEIDQGYTWVCINNIRNNTYRLVCLDSMEELSYERSFILKNGDYFFEFDPISKSIWVNNRRDNKPDFLILHDTINVYSQGDLVVSISLSNPSVFRVWSLSGGSLLREVSLKENDFINKSRAGEESWKFILARIIGIFGELIYFKLGGKYIVVYNIETDQFVYMLGFGKEENYEDLEHLFLTPQLDKFSGALFALTNWRFVEFKLSSAGQSSFRSINLQENLTRLDLGQITGNIARPIKGSLIYFVTVGRSQHQNNLGIFDLSTEKVIEGACFFYPANLGSQKPDFYHHPPLRNICLNDDILYVHYNNKKRTLLTVNVE